MFSAYGIDLSYEKLRKLSYEPRLHPNGFVQLDIADKIRLHVWPDNSAVLPKPKVVTNIHDHTFDFESIVVVGSLTNLIYKFSESASGKYYLYNVKPYAVVKHWVPMVLQDQRRFNARIVGKCIQNAGESYTFPAFRFHETLWDALTLTVIKVGKTYPDRYARVACDVKEVPDNSFRREAADKKVLWSLIEKAFSMAA